MFLALCFFLIEQFCPGVIPQVKFQVRTSMPGAELIFRLEDCVFLSTSAAFYRSGFKIKEPQSPGDCHTGLQISHGLPSTASISDGEWCESIVHYLPRFCTHCVVYPPLRLENKWIKKIGIVVVDGIDVDANSRSLGNDVTVDYYRGRIAVYRHVSPQSGACGWCYTKCFVDTSTQVCASGKFGATPYFSPT
jgi:hypothetical protein